LCAQGLFSHPPPPPPPRVSISRFKFHDRGSVRWNRERWDDLQWELAPGPGGRSAAAAAAAASCSDRTAISLQVWSIVQGTSPDTRPSMGPLLFMSVTMHALMHMLGQHWQRHCHWQDLGGFGHTVMAHDDLQASCVLWLNAGDW
jgi:hypothetical protein